VCSCEVLLCPIADQPQALACWHIACLFTPAEHRGRGYASALLRALQALAAGAPLLLYSDIGPQLYSELGFEAQQPCPPQDLVLPASAYSAAALPSCNSAAAVQDLPYDTDLCALQLPPPCAPPPPGHFELQLTPQRLAWLCQGEAWRVARGAALPLPARGAALPGGLCVWMADASKRELVVLLLRAGTQQGVQALLQRACATARGAQLQRVRVWEDHAGSIAKAVGLLVAWRERREGKLPMMLQGATEGHRAARWVPADRALWY
jgi:hypothetical protein